MLAYDLRSPLRAIGNYSQILMEKCEDKLDEENHGMLGRIVHSTNKMHELITGILSLSHVVRSDLVYEEVDMGSLARSVLEESATQDILGQFSISVSSLPACSGDTTLLRQVWVNLLDNAIKYTKPKSERRIEAGGHAEKGMNVYWVRDTGVGFDPQYSSKLFGVFQRLHADQDFEGTGIGLSIVARIIRRHHGKVWAEGEPGKGATFFFSIPA